MNGTAKTRWARAASWVLAAAVLLFAALLIGQCASIYRAGTAADNLTEAGVRIHDIQPRDCGGALRAHRVVILAADCGAYRDADSAQA